MNNGHSVDAAVEQLIKRVLVDGQYCDQSKAKEIAQAASEKIYEMFKVDCTDMRTELEQLKQRHERLWDHIKPNAMKNTSWWSRTWNKLAFWRRKARSM